MQNFDYGSEYVIDGEYDYVPTPTGPSDRARKAKAKSERQRQQLEQEAAKLEELQLEQEATLLESLKGPTRKRRLQAPTTIEQLLEEPTPTEFLEALAKKGETIKAAEAEAAKANELLLSDPVFKAMLAPVKREAVEQCPIAPVEREDSVESDGPLDRGVVVKKKKTEKAAEQCPNFEFCAGAGNVKKCYHTHATLVRCPYEHAKKKAAKPAKPEKPAKAEKPPKAEKQAKPAKADKPEKLAKPAKADKPVVEPGLMKHRMPTCCPFCARAIPYAQHMRFHILREHQNSVVVEK